MAARAKHHFVPWCHFLSVGMTGFIIVSRICFCLHYRPFCDKTIDFGAQDLPKQSPGNLHNIIFILVPGYINFAHDILKIRCLSYIIHGFNRNGIVNQQSFLFSKLNHK
jgi:hypothetical protein